MALDRFRSEDNNSNSFDGIHNLLGFSLRNRGSIEGDKI